MDDFEQLFQKHSGKFIIGGGSTIFSVVLSAAVWFTTEYSDTETRARMTEAALDAHTAMERENYDAVMGVLDDLQKTTGEIRSDMAVIKYRLNAGNSRIADSDFPSAHMTANNSEQ
jgi:hypothetical protein